MNRSLVEERLSQRWESEPEFRERVERDGPGVLRELYPDAPSYLSLKVQEAKVRIVGPGAPILEPRPAFFPNSDFPFLEKIRSQFDALRGEALGVIREMERLNWVFPNLFRQDNLLERGFRGRFMVWFLGMRLQKNMKRCPIASELCWSLPGLVSAGFYLLGPQTKMLNHVGNRADILRGHFGLVVPEACALKVGFQERAWAEGEFLIFDDTHPHEAWNNSDSHRCVFHFDFYRDPLSDIQQAASTRAMRAKFLAAGPGYFPWLLAAEAETDGDHLEQMRQAVDPNSEQAKIATVLAHHHGVFL